jgi:hypothetical protein
MAEFFQNVFNKDFHGTIYGIGLEESPQNWTMGANQGRSTNSVVHWAGPGVATGTYNLSGKTTLTVNFARPSAPDAFFAIAVDVTATASAAGSVSIHEIVTDLNADAAFSTLMTASVIDGSNEVKDATHGFAGGGGVAKQIDITGKVPGEFYVLNSSAEEVLKFNKKAPIKELITFFKRMSWDVDGTAVEAAATGPRPLIWLDISDANAQVPLTTAGIVSPWTRQADYQLLKGNVPQYQFVKNTYDVATGTDHTVQIAYNAGAVVGDPAYKTTMVYVNNKMTESTTVPYVLESGDLVTP